MIFTDFPRDLVMIGAIFGVAAFVWAGWGQERPPKHWIWRVLLAVLGLGGAALAGVSIPTAIKHWQTPTAIEVGGPAFIAYIVVFWLEVIAIIVLAIWASRRKRKDLIPVFVMAIVGVHFVPLAWVFGQPVLFIAGMLLIGISVIAAYLPDKVAARSFWCGIFGSGVLLIIGTISAVVGFGALG